jgi:CRP-like cAMP-binding protein
LCHLRGQDTFAAGGQEEASMPHSENALVRKLNNFMRLSPAEIGCLFEIQAKPEKIEAQTDIVHEGQTGHRAYILQRGWAYSYKLLPNGGRQVVTFSVPGDFMGLRSVLLRTSDHSFASISDVEVSAIAVPRMIRVFNEFPRLGAAMLWAVSRDEAVTVEHLVGIGRRSAIERLAHFFLELGQRLQLVGLASETEFECPLNQYLLADSLGLTAIHVNRVLRQLRERGLITLKEQYVVIKNLKGLVKLAGFDDGYLDQLSALRVDD